MKTIQCNLIKLQSNQYFYRVTKTIIWNLKSLQLAFDYAKVDSHSIGRNHLCMSIDSYEQSEDVRWATRAHTCQSASAFVVSLVALVFHSAFSMGPIYIMFSICSPDMCNVSARKWCEITVSIIASKCTAFGARYGCVRPFRDQLHGDLFGEAWIDAVCGQLLISCVRMRVRDHISIECVVFVIECASQMMVC